VVKSTGILSQLLVQLSGAGQVYIDIDDYELSDFIDDTLTEENNIELDYYQEIETGKKIVYRMHFTKDYSFEQLKKAIIKISTVEIERIYSLNQKHPSGNDKSEGE